MIIAPDWSILQGIATGLDAPDPIMRKQAQEHMLNTIADALPDVHAIRLYDIKGNYLQIRAATDLEIHTINILDAPNITNCIENSESLWIAAEKQWLYPLLSREGHVFGILEILVDNLDEKWLIWLEIIGEQITPRLTNPITQPSNTQDSLTRRHVDRFMAATQTILAAKDYADLAAAAIHSTSNNVIAIMIGLFEQPISIHETGTDGLSDNQYYTAAIATSTRAQLIERAKSISSLPEFIYIQNLRREIPIVIDNIESEAGYLSGWKREQITNMGIKQIAAFSMTTAEQIVGTLDLLYDKPHRLAEEELSLYESLAKQIATTILSKQLLQRSLEAQQFASQLVKTNKALALAENYEEMALAILNDAPPSIEAVAIALFNRPFTLMGTPVSLKTHALVTRQESIQTELIDQFSAIEDARVTYFLHEFIEGRMMLLWNINRPANPVMLQSLVAQLKQTENVNLITAFGLNMRSSLRGIIVFAGDEDLREKGPQHDGLRAIADQLAAVIENRILLNQTSEALDLIQTQYETSNQVLRSNSLTDILQAIINFSGNAFQSAHLVSTGINGITRIIAEVTNNEGQLVSHPVSLSDYPGSQSLSVLEALEVRNVHEDTFITEDEKQQLLEQNIASFVILPILSNAALDGLVMLTSDEPIRIPPDRIRAMRSLADQVGIVLENQKLLQNTEASLQEIQVLYEANRAMFNTQNDRDVLRVLKNNLAPDTSVICQINIKYQPNHRNQIKAIIFGYELTNQTEKQLQETLTNDQKTMGEIYKYLREIQDNVLFAPTGDIIPDNPINFIANRYNIRSYATIVIKDRGQIASLIYLLFDEPKPFIDTTQRLYEAIADQAIISIEKQKLLRESQLTANKLSDQVQVLQNISDLAVQINLIKEEKVLLDTGTKVLVDALNIDHCGIVLFNEDLKTGKVVSEYPTKNFIGITIDIQDNPILSPGFDLSQAWVIEDVKNDAGITDVLRKTLMDANIYALVIIPLVGNNNELIGSIGLDILNKTRYFNDTEIQTAQTIAAQMAIGLQNIRLLSAAQQRAIQLQHISDFSQASQATLDLDQLIKQALSNIPNILDITHMTISLYDNIHEELVLMGGWQQDHSNRTQLDIGITVPTKNTTAGYVLESGDYLYIPNIQKQSSLVYPLSRTIASLLSVPLRNRGITMGIVAIGSHRANAYTNTDIAVFQQLVNQMSVAIDNAQAYTQSQRIAQNKTLANDIAIKLQRQDTLENMINMTMKEVGRAISAKKGRIRLNNNIQQTDER